MPLDYETIMNWPFPTVEQSYSRKDTIRYALALGLGTDPLDDGQLRYVYERHEAFQTFPTMSGILARPGFWARDPASGIYWEKIVHGEHGMILHEPLPTKATVTSKSRVSEILDKGPRKGALIYLENDLRDKHSGQHYATITTTSFARGDGGFGGPEGPQPIPHSLPKDPPQEIWDFQTSPQAALLYRQTGDRNALHVDPAIANAAGFKVPILHGMCSLGIACHGVLRTYCDYDGARVKTCNARFSAPVYPGETLCTEMWRDSDRVSFRTRVVERDVVAIDNGLVEIAG